MTLVYIICAIVAWLSFGLLTVALIALLDGKLTLNDLFCGTGWGLVWFLAFVLLYFSEVVDWNKVIWSKE